MGLFGDTDAADIPDNPFWVAPDTYYCVLAELSVQEKKDKTGSGLAFKWVIEDEDSDFNGSNVQDWKNIYPDITSDEVTANIRKDMSRLRQRLNQLQIPPEKQDTLLDNLDDYIGMHAYVTVTETADKNDPDIKYTNVQKVAIDPPDEA